ncbi:MAG: aldo/keto reductase [Actinobacteria bacterium]|nr:aldo/keto reductase [Actinomycetota bacterium]
MNKRLCLGTVQFGLNYGISNKKGKPLKEDVFEMMDVTIDRGINFFNTAAACGNAEKFLGEYIINRNLKNKISIISKLMPNLIDESCTNPQNIVEDEIKKSLKKINIDILDGYLLHTPTDFYNQGIMEGLEHCKEKSLVKTLEFQYMS